MPDENYTPLIDRERETKSRIHEELTKPARERLAIITSNMSKYDSTAFDYLIKRVGKSPFTSYYRKRSVGRSSSVEHERFIMKGKTLHVLSYIEIIIKEYHVNRVRKVKQDLVRNTPNLVKSLHIINQMIFQSKQSTILKISSSQRGSFGI